MHGIELANHSRSVLESRTPSKILRAQAWKYGSGYIGRRYRRPKSRIVSGAKIPTVTARARQSVRASSGATRGGWGHRSRRIASCDRAATQNPVGAPWDALPLQTMLWTSQSRADTGPQSAIARGVTEKPCVCRIAAPHRRPVCAGRCGRNAHLRLVARRPASLFASWQPHHGHAPPSRKQTEDHVFYLALGYFISYLPCALLAKVLSCGCGWACWSCHRPSTPCAAAVLEPSATSLDDHRRTATILQQAVRVRRAEQFS